MSLIAINVLGMDIGPITPENVSNDRLKAILNDPDYSSPYDDLSFEMYVDTEVVTMVKDMEMKKHLAVLGKYYTPLPEYVTHIVYSRLHCVYMPTLQKMKNKRYSTWLACFFRIFTTSPR